MKVKWKCIFYNLILPIIVALIFYAIVGAWIIYEYSKPIDPTVLNVSMQQVQYTSVGSYSVFPLGQIVILVITIALSISVVRGMLKPCIITEQGITDDIARGISVIGELISFSICIGVGLVGVVCSFIGIAVIKSIMDGNVTRYGPDLSIFIIAGVCFVVSYGIYWFNKESYKGD
jgi:hypothetical protein